MNKLNEDSFIKAIRMRLDESLVEVDSVITTRLDSMRQQALSAPRLPEAVDNEALIGSVLNTLDDHAALPPAIEASLDNIRRQAMARLQKADSRDKLAFFGQVQDFVQSWYRANLAMANMAATACVMVTVVSIFYVSSRQAGTLSLEEEISLIASAEDIELYENLDFYLWLEENGLPN